MIPVSSKQLLPPGSSSTFRDSSNQDLEEFVKLGSTKIAEENILAATESQALANESARPSQMDVASMKDHMIRE